MSKEAIIHFGKHKGSLVRDLEDSYLHWLANQADDFRGTIAGIHAPKAALMELERRQGRGPGIEGGQLPIKETSSVNLSPAGNEPLDKLAPVQVAIEALFLLNLFHEVLLKQFVIRVDQQDKPSDWLVKLCEEAVRYGTSVEATDHFKVTYANLIFHLKGGSVTTLLNVEKKP